jgi:hypothetical protein
MKLLSRIGLVFMILIVGSVTMCAVQKRAVYADPDVTPAFEQARARAQPLVEALGRYYASHSYYPRSIEALMAHDGGTRGFRYEVWGANRVYRSMDCAGRAREFTGFVAAIPDYEQRLEDFRADCVRGYSSFLLKSPRLPTAWGFNQGTVVWAQFASQDARWSVEWCTSHDHQQLSGFSDCSYTVFDEALGAGTATRVQRPRRTGASVTQEQ